MNKFLIESYGPPFRLDRDNNGGGIMLFISKDIQCKLLSVENHPKEDFYIEVNLRKTKWLFCYSYYPIRCKIDLHLEKLNEGLASYSSHYESFIIIREVNVETNDSAISVFSDTYDLQRLIIKTPINLLALTLV